MPMQNSLTTEPIPELVRRIAVPASIGFFFNTMYNVVDTYFAGLISTQALASLSLSLPVFFIIIATGTGVSTGATALIANALGAGKREEARLYAAQAISFGILTAWRSRSGLISLSLQNAGARKYSPRSWITRTPFFSGTFSSWSLYAECRPEWSGRNQTL
jgi:hypothetical protein